MTARWRQLTSWLAASWLRLVPARRRAAACRLRAAEQQLTSGAAVTRARLAAVRELVTIADTYQGRYKQHVVDLLCAHLRVGAAAGSVPPGTAEPGVSTPADPVQALVLAEIARHLRRAPRGRAKRAAVRQPGASATTGVPPTGAALKAPEVPASSWAQCGFDLRGVHLTADVDWAGCYFAGPVCFAGAVFDGEVQLHGATFRGGPDFSSASFRSAVDCSRAKFGAAASFRQASFARRTTFAHSRFGARADFSDCLFAAAPLPADTYFSSARFGPEVSFQRAVFRGYAMFPFARFAAAPSFRAARFELSVSFHGTRLGPDADFRDTTFLPGRERPRYLDDMLDAKIASFELATFGSGATFAGADFAAPASFTVATFRGPVSFVAAHFRANASFTTTRFRRPPDYAGACGLPTLPTGSGRVG